MAPERNNIVSAGVVADHRDGPALVVPDFCLPAEAPRLGHADAAGDVMEAVRGLGAEAGTGGCFGIGLPVGEGFFAPGGVCCCTAVAVLVVVLHAHEPLFNVGVTAGTGRLLAWQATVTGVPATLPPTPPLPASARDGGGVWRGAAAAAVGPKCLACEC